MATTTGTFPDAYGSLLSNLDDIVRDNMETEGDRAVLDKLYHKRGPERIPGTDFKITGLSGLGQLSQVGETETHPEDNPVQGYDKTFTPLKHGLRVVLSDEAFEDDQHDSLSDLATQLGRSAPYTMEVLRAAVFNNGFGTETAADGVAVFSTAHLNPAAANWANTPAVAGDLSLATLEQMDIDMGDIVDQAGKIINVGASGMRWLLIAREFNWTARRIFESAGIPMSANNDINPARGMLSIVVSELLTDTDAWFAVGEPDPKQLIEGLKRPIKRPAPQRDERNETTDMVVSMRVIHGVHEGKNLYGNPGA